MYTVFGLHKVSRTETCNWTLVVFFTTCGFILPRLSQLKAPRHRTGNGMLASHSRIVDSEGNYRQLAAIPRINSDTPRHRAVASMEALLKAAAAVMARDSPKVATHKLCHSQLEVLRSRW